MIPFVQFLPAHGVDNGTAIVVLACLAILGVGWLFRSG